jgi:hypothetical protein
LVLAMTIAVAGCGQPDERAQSAPPADGSTQASTRLQKRITWPPDGAIDREALAALPSQAAAAVERSPVPVLVVDRPEVLAQAKIIARPNWVSLSSRSEGVTISLQASKVAHRYPHIAAASGEGRVRGQPAFVTRNTGIWSAAWIENGAAYALDVECARLPDPRCDDEHFLLELASQLTYVGGARP